jgi:hypothetical protein
MIVSRVSEGDPDGGVIEDGDAVWAIYFGQRGEHPPKKIDKKTL